MAVNTDPDGPVRRDDERGCDPDDVAIKSFFLGPQAENADWFRAVFEHIVETYLEWRRRIHADDGRAISVADRAMPQFVEKRRVFRSLVHELLQRFEREVPKFSPRYIGHMFSETSMPAMVGHVVTLLHNPNNVSGESSRVGVQLEEEAVGELVQMLGFADGCARGHFTSGGTVANFEAMTRARHRLDRFIALGAEAKSAKGWGGSLFEAAHMGWQSYDELCDELDGDRDSSQFELLSHNPFEVAARLNSVFAEPYRGPVVLVPDHKHYSWVKGVELLGLGREAFWSVDLDHRGVMSIEHLGERIEEARRKGRPVLMVVSVAGTTELGAFDPVAGVQDLLDRYAVEQNIHIYHHVDAAYGGFFAANICGESPGCIMEDGVCDAVGAIHRANSVTLDPHKLGYVPYSSGAFLAADEREYFSNSVDAPYVAFDPDSDRGPQTIEGSRSAAGAVATWLTARTIGLDADGYGRILRRTLVARRRVQQALQSVDVPVRVIPPSSNILAFYVAHDGESLSAVNRRTQEIYEAFSPATDAEFYVSKTALRFSEYEAMLQPLVESWDGQRDDRELIVIRLCLMNPFIVSRETKTDFPGEFARAVADVVG